KSLNPSKANYDDLTKVNVTNQVNHIKEIAKEPHSIFDVEAKKKVQDYLVKELDKLGVEPKLYEYDDVYVERTDSKEDIQNIYGEIKGKSDSYIIMLVTNYDSSHAKTEGYAEKDGSHGAADAGYALSTILETLRVIKESDTELVTGIKILITDGEEYGLLGAKEAVKEEEIFEGVNDLINIESRGTKGPAIMFETSPNNAPVLDLYEHSEKPFSYSITPEIYRLLPNGTDFTVFLDSNITGINISVLDGLENYHTPNDNIESISEKSLQHYGDQVLPIVSEFVSNEYYSNPSNLEGSEDSIFFTLGSSFIKYSQAINYVLLVIIALGIVFLYKKFNVRKVGVVVKYTLANLVFTLGIAGVAYVITRVVASLNGRDFKLTYLPLMKFEGFIVLSVIAITFILYLLMLKKLTIDFKERNEFILGSLTLLLILSILLTLTLPGATYLTVFPALLITIFTVINTLLDRKLNINISYIMLIPIVIITILYVPTIYLFNCALTFGALSANMIFVMIAFMSLVSGMVSIKNLL
ncbi:MAG: M28 family peptidase, partial [Paraclostridium sp.]